MSKKYIKSYGGKQNFIDYHRNLVKINSSENEKSNTINSVIYKVNYKKWLFFFYVYSISSIGFKDLNNTAYITVSILTIIMLALYILPLLLESWIGLKKSGIKYTLKWITLGVVLMFSLNYLNAIFFDLVGFESLESGNQLIIKSLLEDNFVRVIFEATILAAIYEELIFRGIFFRGFYQKSRILAYVMTFIAFGIPHLFIGLAQIGFSELYFLPIYGLMGVIFAYVYEKTGSIYTAMGSHLINNLLSILAITFL